MTFIWEQNLYKRYHIHQSLELAKKIKYRIQILSKSQKGQQRDPPMLDRLGRFMFFFEVAIAIIYYSFCHHVPVVFSDKFPDGGCSGEGWDVKGLTRAWMGGAPVYVKIRSVYTKTQRNCMQGNAVPWVPRPYTDTVCGKAAARAHFTQRTHDVIITSL